MAQAAKPSDKPDASEAPPAPPPPKRSGKWLLIILLIAVLLLIVVVAGVGALLLLKKDKGGSSDDTSHGTPAAAVAPPSAVPAPPAPVAVDLTKPPVYVPFDPFTINLRATDNDPEKHYLQATIALQVADPKTGDALKGWTPAIRNTVILLLSSKSLEDVQSSHEPLQTEIMNALNKLFVPEGQVMPGQTPQGPIQGVLFPSFIVQ